MMRTITPTSPNGSNRVKPRISIPCIWISTPVPVGPNITWRRLSHTVTNIIHRIVRVYSRLLIFYGKRQKKYNNESKTVLLTISCFCHHYDGRYQRPMKKKKTIQQGILVYYSHNLNFDLVTVFLLVLLLFLFFIWYHRPRWPVGDDLRTIADHFRHGRCSYSAVLVIRAVVLSRNLLIFVSSPRVLSVVRISFFFLVQIGRRRARPSSMNAGRSSINCRKRGNS